MADGGRAGKVTGQQLAAEMEAKAAKEAADFAAMGVQVTGRGAQTVCFMYKQRPPVRDCIDIWFSCDNLTSV